MNVHKFDSKKLDRLNNPERLNLINTEEIIRALNLNDESIIVDIGVGTGIFSEHFLEKLPKAKGFGFDISKEMIKWIKENREVAVNGRLNVSVMNESDIPLEEKVADLVFMITVHHELEHPVELLKDIRRVLKDSGKLLICDWKEGVNKHFVTKESIINDLKEARFNNIKELNNSEKLVCIIAN